MIERKKVWIFCHYAQQPPYNTMLRYHNWGKYLFTRGYSVTIVAASIVHNTDIDVVKISENKYEQTVDNVRYFYVRTPRYMGNGLSRILNMAKYCIGISSFRKYKDIPDIVFFSGAYLYPFVKGIFKGIPLVCDIVDLWPLSIVEYTDVKKTNLLIKYLYFLEKKAYIKSNAIIFSMEGGSMYVSEQKYAKRLENKPIFHINMGIDMLEYTKHLSFVSEIPKVASEFMVTYSGSMRLANNILQLCEAAEIVRKAGYNSIKFRFYGNGPDESVAKNYCQDNNIDNVTFFGRFDKNQLPNILASSSVNIMTYKTTRVMKYGGSQSKLFDYLASGKPVISCGNWGYNLVSTYNCGLVVSDPTSDNIADAIIKLFHLSTDDIMILGENARKVAEMYDQPNLVEKLDDIIVSLLSDYTKSHLEKKK